MSYYMHSIPRYICRSHQTPIKEFYQNSLLSCNSCHPTTYVFKISISYHDFIS